MAVSKRLRFEVLKRDNHTCRYCGGSAPDVKLTVDHVLPVALGGRDEASNLVAACADCNSGKSSVPPGADLVADVQADAIRWAAARMQAIADVTARDEAEHKFWTAFAWLWWNDLEPEGRWELPTDVQWTLKGMARNGLPEQMMEDSFWIAQDAEHVSRRDKFRYFVGVTRNKLAEVDERTQELIAAGGDA